MGRSGLPAPSGHRQRVLQQRLAAVGGPHRHGVEARQLLGGAVAGLEAPVGVGGRAEGAGLLQLVVLELLGVVLKHPELGGGLRLHVLGRRVHGLVRARVVGHVVVPGATSSCAKPVAVLASSWSRAVPVVAVFLMTSPVVEAAASC